MSLIGRVVNLVRGGAARRELAPANNRPKPSLRLAGLVDCSYVSAASARLARTISS